MSVLGIGTLVAFRVHLGSRNAHSTCIQRLNRRWGEVNIPHVGRVRFRWTCPLPGVSSDCSGRITGARLTKNSLGWHICFRAEVPAAQFSSSTGPPIGVDRGVIHSLALSDGRNLDMPRLCLDCLRVGKNADCATWNAEPHTGACPGRLGARCPIGSEDPTERLLRCALDRPGVAKTGCTRPQRY